MPHTAAFPPPPNLIHVLLAIQSLKAKFEGMVRVNAPADFGQMFICIIRVQVFYGAAMRSLIIVEDIPSVLGRYRILQIP